MKYILNHIGSDHDVNLIIEQSEFYNCNRATLIVYLDNCTISQSANIDIGYNCGYFDSNKNNDNSNYKIGIFMMHNYMEDTINKYCVFIQNKSLSVTGEWKIYVFNDKLYINFDIECASDYQDVKSNVQNLVEDNKNNLYLDKHKQNIYYINSTGSHRSFVYLKYSGCEDDINVDYDKYSIEDFDYEPEFDLLESCSSESSYSYIYRSDVTNGSTCNTYDYVTSRRGSSCSWQDIEDSSIATVNKLLENPSRRGVINMSFDVLGGSNTERFYENYFTQMIGNGDMPGASAGNFEMETCTDDGYYFVPTGADDCITVASHDSAGAVSSFSNYGKCVDVYGHDSSVFSATNYDDSSYTYVSETSLSGPAVVGLIGNLLYVNDEVSFDERNCNGTKMTCDDIIDETDGNSKDDDHNSDNNNSEEITYFTCDDGHNKIPFSFVNDGSGCDYQNYCW